MQVSETKDLSSPNELSKEIKNMSNKSSRKLTQASHFSLHWMAIDDLWKKELMLKMIQDSKSKDIDLLKELFSNDATRNLYSNGNPKNILNAVLFNNQRPLYLACLNGNLECVWFLLKEGCDPLLKSSVGIFEEESVL